MAYTVATVSLIDESILTIIQVLNDDGSISGFTADTSNQFYLAWLETEDGKAYLASQKDSE